MHDLPSYTHIEELLKDAYIHAALDECQRPDLKFALDSGSEEQLSALLESNPQDEILKILWCHVQAKQDLLPLAFVASSLNEAVHVGDGSRLAPRLSFIASAAVSLLLARQKEFRIGLLLLSAFLDINEAEFLHSSDEKKSFRALLRNFLSLESDAANSRKENKSYFAHLDDLNLKLDERERQATLTHEGVRPSHSKIAETGFSVAGIKANDLGVSENFTLGEPDGLSEYKPPRVAAAYMQDEEDLKSGAASSNNSIPEGRIRTGFNPINLLGLGVLALVAIFSILVFFKPYNVDLQSILKSILPINGHSNENRLVFRFSGTASSPGKLAELPPHHKLSTSTNLELLNDRLRNIASPKLPPDISNIQVASKPVVSPAVDFDEIESLDSLPESEGIIKEAKQIPPIKGSTQDAIKGNVENLGTSERAQDAVTGKPLPSSQIRIRADGRTYGQPQMDDPLANAGRNSISSDPQRALDGSPLRSYEVEKFEPPKVFETLTATNVLSAPSLLAPSITRLEAGTPIQVTAKMGLWIEIRSNGGKIGYIYAQDAAE